MKTVRGVGFLTPEQITAALEAYVGGATYEDAGALVGVTGAAIAHHARKRGIPSHLERRRRGPSQEYLDGLARALAQPGYRTMGDLLGAAGVLPTMICYWRKRAAEGAPEWAACSALLKRMDEYAKRLRPRRHARRADGRTGPFVYFIEAIGIPRVKIGFSRRNPYNRLRAMEVGSPVGLRIIGAVVVPGAEIESWLHQRHDGAWTHGEWFDLTPTLRHEINTLLLHGRVESVDHATEVLGRNHSSRPHRNGELA